MWGSFHPGGINFVWGDGSVHTIGIDIDMNIFVALSTMQAGDSLKNYVP